jgi:uncharacterized protein YbbC (DUF1343 family)/CubicO group peptidase (beta-lactamase class C family)
MTACFPPRTPAALARFVALSILLAARLPAADQDNKPRGATNSAFASAKLAEIDREIEKGMAEKRLPGAVFHLERQGAMHEKAYGKRAVVPDPEEMTAETIFDLASLTKVFATAPSIMLLAERGQIEIGAPVSRYLPEFGGKGRDEITIRHLLTHTSGLRPGVNLGGAARGYDAGIERALGETPARPPGTEIVYSDINFILLGEIVRRVSGETLDRFAARSFYEPLKMTDTGFLPARSTWSRVAPTEVVDGAPLRGIVHDPTSRHMGGVCGHAGLFGTVGDLAKFCRMILNEGELDGVRVLKASTIRLMATVQTPLIVDGRRGLGWDIDTGYSRRGNVFPIGSYGHTGWTGGMVWIDPFSKTFVIMLSNRVHPDGHGDIRTLERTLSTLSAEAVTGFDFAHVAEALPPAPKPLGADGVAVLNGVDVLETNGFGRLRGLKIGLVTNHTGRDRQGRATIDLLQAASEIQLKVLFSPEHGIRGDRDEQVGDSVDARSGLPVYSLYGKRRAPEPEQLAGLDALVYDIQDVGTRFYTYIATLGNCLEAAGKAKIRFIVLDRVNPINGEDFEGPINEGGSIFTAYHPMPTRHGMTLGELAKMINDEKGFRAELEVAPVLGWKRSMWFDQTGLSWVNTSPNMRNLTEATLYPGIGLLETAAVSVGRGTEAPFERVGAPYVDEEKLAGALNSLGLPGLRFEPVRFTPDASVFKGQTCGGVRILLMDRAVGRPVMAGLAIARTLRELYPERFVLEKINTHMRNRATLDALARGDSLSQIEDLWKEGLRGFESRRSKYLIY